VTEHATLDERVRSESAARRGRERAETRRTILDAATRIFADVGAEQASMRQIAAAAGYTATTIYNYFEDKDDLLFNVVLDGFGTFGERLREAADGEDDPAERYVALGLAYVGFAVDFPFHYQLMFIDKPELLDRELPDGSARPIESFETLEWTISEAVEAGVLPAHVDQEMLALETWAQVHGVAAMMITSDYLDESQALSLQRHAGRTMLRGLRQEASEERGANESAE
jgi:AcrR family transcriptional regulator